MLHYYDQEKITKIIRVFYMKTLFYWSNISSQDYSSSLLLCFSVSVYTKEYQISEIKFYPPPHHAHNSLLFYYYLPACFLPS
mmetsp:Transcript_112156/g.219903  ORF Transcript_112156/g.219903 Transcript_112156/m.219903 type:complete len:82 (+) Transcript_112156:1884-2129(+)